MLGEDLKGQNTPVRQKMLHSPTKLTESPVMHEEFEANKVERVL